MIAMLRRGTGLSRKQAMKSLRETADKIWSYQFAQLGIGKEPISVVENIRL